MLNTKEPSVILVLLLLWLNNKLRYIAGSHKNEDQSGKTDQPNLIHVNTTHHDQHRLDHVTDKTANITRLLDTLLNGYDPRVRPDYGKQTLKVKTNIFVKSFGPISENKMHYTMDCYFRQEWKDDRLKFTGPLKVLPLHINMLDRLWRPDTYIYGGRNSYVHTLTIPNKLLRLSEDGTVFYSMRLTIQANCPMDLHFFPNDKQTCRLNLLSYAYDNQELRYMWSNGVHNSIKFSKEGVSMSQFHLMEWPASYTTMKVANRTFSMLAVQFRLERHIGFFLLQVYVPAILVVVLSWVSFCINREATSDRVNLGITCVLTLAAMNMETRHNLPQVPYATALDWFMVMCFGFLVAALVELSIVHYFTKRNVGDIANRLSAIRALVQSDTTSEEDTESDTCAPKGRQNKTETRKFPFAHMFHFRANKNENRAPLAYENHSFTPQICANQAPAEVPLSNGVIRNENTTLNEPPAPCPTYVEAMMQYNTIRVERHWHGKSSHKFQWMMLIKKCVNNCLRCIISDQRFRQKRISQARRGSERKNSPSVVDKIARVLFPLTFTILNIAYWVSIQNEFVDLDEVHEQRRL